MNMVMKPAVHKIPFSRCPISKHCGEPWPKLAPVDKTKQVTLWDVQTCWSHDFYKEGIRFIKTGKQLFNFQLDTFADFTEKDVEELMTTFYDAPTVFGIVLLLEQDDHFFTTFRAYEPRKHMWYKSMIGKKFMVVMAGSG